MINLIPKQEKREMIKGFRYRLIVLFLLVAGFSFLIALVSILPSYFLLLQRSNVVNMKIEKQKSEPIPSPDQKTLAVIKDLNNKLKLIENSDKNKFDVTQKVINAILLEKMPSIKIIDIFFENDPLKGKKVSIQGTAPSREVLLLFRLALESESLFKKVDLPISNFIKGSNIQFYLSLIPS